MFSETILSLAATFSVPSSIDTVLTCPEDTQASAITYRMSGLPEEVRRDVIEVTRGLIGERPNPLRRSDVITSENRDHLNVRFYRALLFRDTWYVQIEPALMSIHTLGYARLANGDFGRVVGLHFAGPPCETVRAALSGVMSSVWYLSR